jgi:cell division transport system permease protein
MTPGAVLLAEDGRDMLTAILATLIGLVLLIAAFGLGVAGTARLIDRQGQRLTVQVAPAAGDPALAVLRTMPGVVRAVPVDRATVLRLLRPWLGDDPTGLPIPTLIDVDLRDPAMAEAIAMRLNQAVAVIRVDRADRWLAPVTRLLHRLLLVAVLLVLLLGAAAVGVVRAAARRGVARHHDTIALLHALGATPRQIAAPFRQRMLRSVLIAAAIGGAGALLVTLVVQAATAAIGSAFATGSVLRPADWGMLAAILIALAVLAIGTAQRVVAAALERLP